MRREDNCADISRVGQKIDALVYGLYGLTPEETKIVEGAAR